MNQQQFSLPTSVAKNLTDKLYEKRKLGALEVEQLAKQLASSAQSQSQVKQLIQLLGGREFAGSSNQNAKKGGLIALAAMAIGLGPGHTGDHVQLLLPPILQCFTDQDMRVRYYACESLYNVAKVCRSRVLQFFNEIFDGLCKLAADPDQNVKNGAALLDRLVKDVVTEAGGFDLDRFVPLLRERIYVINPFCRQFLVSWISVLDSVPDLDLLQYLPEFLDGLFNMLKDTNKIRQAADQVLSEFLLELKAATTAAASAGAGAGAGSSSSTPDFGALLQIVVDHSSSKDDFTRRTALEWIAEFVEFGGVLILPWSSVVLGGVVPSLAHAEPAIETGARRANQALLHLIQDQPEHAVPLDRLLAELGKLFSHEDDAAVPSRLACLHWLLLLHGKAPDRLVSRQRDFQGPLLLALSDESEAVVRLDLELLANLSRTDPAHLTDLLRSIIHRFRNDSLLLERRCNLIVRHLGAHVPPEQMYRLLASILNEELESPPTAASSSSSPFASDIIQTLNLILLTAPEFSGLRQQLLPVSADDESAIAASDGGGGSACSLFTVLSGTWARNPAALFSLCLMAGQYKRACEQVDQFAATQEQSITVSFLMEIDKLIQLIESPVFVRLRLQLLQPDQHPYLFRCLFSLLMLIPQSSAFDTLKRRLSVAKTFVQINGASGSHAK